MALKVLDLACSNGHGFEGWFASLADSEAQLGEGRLRCPVCASPSVQRRPSAPRLNLLSETAAKRVDDASTERRADTSAASVAAGLPLEMQAALLRAARELVLASEDVGDRFAAEARRIHYGEAAERGIRGRSRPDELQSLREEGIEVFTLPLPPELTGPLQ